MAGAIEESDYSVITGFELVFDSVADLGGKLKVLIAFPGSTYAQSKDYVDRFKTIISTKCYKQDQSGTTECLEDMPTGTLLGVSITNTFQYALMIRDIFAEVGNNLPDISLVRLLRFNSPNEALTVRTEGLNKGQVFFKTFDSDLDLDDASRFFRVGFFLDSTNRVIIWISLEYLLPIAIKPDTNDRELYALLPQSLIGPSGQDPPADPLNWLRSVLNNLVRFQSILLFRQNGTDSRAVIHLDSDPVDTASRRVSRATDSVAIIENSNLEFFVGIIHIYDLQ